MLGQGKIIDTSGANQNRPTEAAATPGPTQVSAVAA